MELDNVAVQWPRTGRGYDRVDPAEFADFATLAERVDRTAPAAAALARSIAKAGTVSAEGYADLVDLLLGLTGVLKATEAASEDEDPVIDPDGCAWVAGGLERFVERHLELGTAVTFESVAQLLRAALAGARLADQQLLWLQQRLAGLRDAGGGPPDWAFSLAELGVLAKFYRRCSDQGHGVYARY